MAEKAKLPGFKEKRRILFGPRTSPDKMRQTGQLFMEAQRYYDALEFFERCHAEDLTRRIVKIAIESGDTPLLMRAKRVLREEITEEEWTEVARRAEEAGMYSCAYLAHMKAGHKEEAERLLALIPRPQGPQPPQSPAGQDGPSE